MICLRIFLFVISLCFLTGNISFAQNPKPIKGGCDDLGRYQLFQGTYTAFDLKRQETYTHQGIFLIDTKTGKVSRYLNKIDPQGKYIETWMPTDLLPEKQ